MVLQIVAYVIIGIYTVALLCITGYCILQFHLLLLYRKFRKENVTSLHIHDESKLPFVTVQLPVYNERFVVERLIDNIIRLDYPINKLEIQVLDDSTDDTSALCKRKIDEYRSYGISICHYHRPSRAGFKAGALQEGLEKSKGDYIAIFDADFLPPRDFLLKTIPLFADATVGAVQSRWSHINEGYSLITKLQAFQLNVHFTVEQSGRQAGGYFLQFNGTSGVWRKSAILDAGGWQADTLTEDLDLSYRAQIKGWQIKYLQHLDSPAELPSEMMGLKSQQFRWMKGGAQNARKLLPAILRSDLPLLQKLHAGTHLLSSSIFLLVFILGVISVPALFLMHSIDVDAKWFGIFMIGILATGIIYYYANKDTAWPADSNTRRAFKFLYTFPLFLSLSMGLSFHNSVAVFEGFRGKKSKFVRTPKFNIKELKDQISTGFYEAKRIPASTIVEGILALYFLIAIVFSLQQGKTSFLIYHTMLMIGFGSIFVFSIKHAYNR